MMSGVVKVSDGGNVFTIHVAPAVFVNPHHGQANGDNGEEETQPANYG